MLFWSNVCIWRLRFLIRWQSRTVLFICRGGSISITTIVYTLLLFSALEDESYWPKIAFFLQEKFINIFFCFPSPCCVPFPLKSSIPLHIEDSSKKFILKFQSSDDEQHLKQEVVNVYEIHYYFKHEKTSTYTVFVDSVYDVCTLHITMRKLVSTFDHSCCCCKSAVILTLRSVTPFSYTTKSIILISNAFLPRRPRFLFFFSSI